LTDAIAEEAAKGKVHGFRFRGQRYDCGSKAGFLQATVAFGWRARTCATNWGCGIS
jgi:UTP--glucose-1-phosphate uridylyltransferase